VAAGFDEPGELITPQDAAKRLCMSYAWLRKKVAAREVPFVRLGRSVRFTEAHLREIINANAQSALHGPHGSARTRL
jgi:excisionase family DNA binding protein